MGGGYFTMGTYYVAGVPYSSELYHHGIKGQKWGIRRFQNPDGTYTEAGKKRYDRWNKRLERYNRNEQKFAERTENWKASRKKFEGQRDIDKADADLVEAKMRVKYGDKAIDDPDRSIWEKMAYQRSLERLQGSRQRQASWEDSMREADIQILGSTAKMEKYRKKGQKLSNKILRKYGDNPVFA